MSRIGNKLITLPAGVTLTVSGSVVTVKGPKGSLDVTLNHGISLEVEGSTVKVLRESDEKQVKQNHGTSRANLNNAVIGVSQGFKKVLKMIGIGYRATVKGNDIVLTAGYSHDVTITPVDGCKIEVAQKNNFFEITVTGISKQAVGQTAALIREVRPPEPYLGKGIRYEDEHITLKEGKRAASSGKK